MAIDTIPTEASAVPTGEFVAPLRRPRRPLPAWKRIFMALASLKLTVALMAMGIFLVLAGTLAQAEAGMWEAIDKYFASYLVLMNLQIFFPQAFFPNLHVPAIHFPFPGGASIGLAMIVNLLAAHAIRFRIQARGSRLLFGLLVAGLGVAATWLIIAMGHNKEGLQGEPFFEWSQFWFAIKVVLGLVWAALFYPLVRLTLRSSAPRYLEAILVAGLQCGLTALLAYMISTRTELSPSSLRILWQLLQGGLAGIILLAGGILLFRKRAGIVLIHAGILLMMFGQYVATVYNVEERMSIREGETARYAEDIRTVELAIVDHSPADHDNVVVIPQQLLQESLESGKRLSDPQLPFDVEVVRYFPNADLERAKPEDDNPATAGLGLQYVAKPARVNSGADAGGGVDLAAAYVRLYKKGSNELLGTHLVSVLAAVSDEADTVTLDEAKGAKQFDLSLRFKRSYKPYAMTLIDVVKEDYSGTSKARSYASLVRIVDPERHVDQEAKIWMNNPLRYAGETFYQSRYDPGMGGREVTELQVVKNNGWMIPYVACMIVGVGLVAHFWSTLLRFLVRREQALFSEREENPYAVVAANSTDVSASKRRGKKRARSSASRGVSRTSQGWFALAIPAAITLLGIVWLTYPLVPREVPGSRGMDLNAFGALPVLHEGRVKPLDTMARTTLRIVSNRETFKDSDGQTQPAIRWLLDVISESPQAAEHRVIRIDNTDVLQDLGLEERPGSFRYSIAELRGKFDELERQIGLAHAAANKDMRSLTTFQRKILELDRRLNALLVLTAAFRAPRLPATPPTLEQIQNDEQQRQLARRMMQMLAEEASMRDADFERMQAPRVIPDDNGEWKPFASAYSKSYLHRWHNMLNPNASPEPVNDGALTFGGMLTAYREKNTLEFNRHLRDYQAYLSAHAASAFVPAKVEFEAIYNRAQPFFHAQWAYFVAFLLAVFGFMGITRILNRSAFWLICAAFVVHTAAIAARIYISGRPPVTTLYSSAIFIGWAAVIAGMAIEVLFRLGIGNLIASIGGFATLIIAGFLATSGDTMPVLEAVLDTQFWLSTHVVCITLGYSATYVAGLLGLIYVIDRAFVRRLNSDDLSALTRMTYGTLCFALTFSFIGTVLGGLWADDSWGRFWGWDPKENGALIIVLWNALVLHARWDKMVRDRGLALLAIGGNIATSWSWFGTNQLGIGLHSYGFTEGVLLALLLFVASQLAMIVIGGFLPQRGHASLAASE